MTGNIFETPQLNLLVNASHFQEVQNPAPAHPDFGFEISPLPSH